MEACVDMFYQDAFFADIRRWKVAVIEDLHLIIGK
jgi:hypothetical protein